MPRIKYDLVTVHFTRSKLIEADNSFMNLGAEFKFVQRGTIMYVWVINVKKKVMDIFVEIDLFEMFEKINFITHKDRLVISKSIQWQFYFLIFCSYRSHALET